MGFTLVEKQSRWSDESLFALWVCGFEEMSLCDEHEASCLGSGQHHTGTPMNVSLEYLPVPVLNFELKFNKEDQQTEY